MDAVARVKSKNKVGKIRESGERKMQRRCADNDSVV